MKYYMSGANNNRNKMMNNQESQQNSQSNMSNSKMQNSLGNSSNMNNSNTQSHESMNTEHNMNMMEDIPMTNSLNENPAMMNNSDMQRENSVDARTRRNSPNPPWPSMQPVVVMPPGSNTTSIGLPDANIYKNRLSVDTGDNQRWGNLNMMSSDDADNMRLYDESRSRNAMQSNMNDYVSMGMSDMRMDNMNSDMTMNNRSLGTDMRNVHGMMPSNNAMNYRISDMVRMRPPYMEDMTLTEYLAGRIGEYIKVDLCCGGVGNSKVGVLREIGDDFIVLEEVESGNYMVCSMKGIQLIHVYDDGDNE